MQEAEAPAFAFTRTGKTIVDDHRIIDDRIDPVKALCAIRVCNCAEKRYIIVFIVVRKYRNIVSVCKCRAVSPCFNTAETDQIRLPEIKGTSSDQFAESNCGVLSLTHCKADLCL